MSLHTALPPPLSEETGYKEWRKDHEASQDVHLTSCRPRGAQGGCKFPSAGVPFCSVRPSFEWIRAPHLRRAKLYSVFQFDVSLIGNIPADAAGIFDLMSNLGPVSLAHKNHHSPPLINSTKAEKLHPSEMQGHPSFWKACQEPSLRRV